MSAPLTSALPQTQTQTAHSSAAANAQAGMHAGGVQAPPVVQATGRNKPRTR